MSKKELTAWVLAFVVVGLLGGAAIWIYQNQDFEEPNQSIETPNVRPAGPIPEPFPVEKGKG